MLKPLETVELFKSQTEQTVKAGEIIFREGEQGKVMYGIVKGEVEMLLNGHVIETLKQGEVFGQGALVHEDYCRASTAVAKTDCQLASLDRKR